VAGGKVFLSDYAVQNELKDEGNFDRKPTDGTESVLAFDAATGKQLWKQSYPVKYAISYPAGPRCTPLVSGDLVYFLGAEGHLLACDVNTGAIKWQKQLKDEYKTKSALWGYAAHPLLDGNKLITLAGGEGSHVVALDKDTGKELWRSQTQPEQGYSPPLLTTAGGVRQLIVPGPAAIRGLDPDTGKRLWTTPYEARNGSIIMTPVRVGDYVLVGGYDVKCVVLKLLADKPGVEVVWQDKKGLGIYPVNVQPIADGGVIYGVDGGGEMMAVEVPSGNRLWTSTAPIVPDKKLGTGTAFLVKTGDRYILFNELGELVLCKLSPQGYEEIDRAKVIDQTGRAFGRKVVWSMPAFAGKRAYIRNDKELICVDLAK
jgi:outer membrane protein assembly factor BamB